ncbi:ead/Ea22-like family protein [Serratia sp. CY68630]|uniref:ead/Ea22-like family protein n=1 Tax=Serratia sp. CY68630 TaxID=3383666 RepID=UPI003FA11F96
MKTTRNELKLRADKCPIKRFKAFIGKANTQATLCADTGIEIIGWSGFDASDLNAKSHRVELARFIAAADPETILALLAELEAKDKRIAELEEEFAFIMGQNDGMEKELRDKDARIEHLEAKLATPVRLPDTRQSVSGDRYQWSDGVFNYKQDAIALLREQGFIIEGGE